MRSSPIAASISVVPSVDPSSTTTASHVGYVCARSEAIAIGSVDAICDELQRRRELYGISYVAVLDDGENNMVEAFAPVVARLAGR